MRPIEGINLTPMIDMITCLMFFLLMFASILPVVIIDAPLPKVASTAEEVKLAKQQDSKMEVTVWINANGFTIKSDFSPDHSMPLGAGGNYPYDALHKYLVQLHSKKPASREITLIPSDDISYAVMIEAMDAARELTKDDPGYQKVPPEIAHKPESLQFNRLFPDVSIGGV